MRLTMYRPTTEDWHGSFSVGDGLKLVRVTLAQIEPDKSKRQVWRVAVFGTDDHGVIKDFEYGYTDMDQYAHLARLEYLNHENLKTIGFTVF